MQVTRTRRRCREIHPRVPDQTESPASLSDGQPNMAWVDIPFWDRTCTLRKHQRLIESLTGYDVRLQKCGPDGPKCPSKWTSGYKCIEAAQGAYRILNHDPRPTDSDLDVAFAQFGLTRSGTHRQLHEWNLARKEYRERYAQDTIRPPCLQVHKVELAAAGPSEIDGPRYRSKFERRTAAALDRLGIGWEYEPDWFYYRDWNGRQRRYIPDFQLTDFHMTFIEVKGPKGADAGDQHKMAQTLATYPNLTLLLWDASVIEYVEDMTDRTQLLPLLRTTSLRAA